MAAAAFKNRSIRSHCERSQPCFIKTMRERERMLKKERERKFCCQLKGDAQCAVHWHKCRIVGTFEGSNQQNKINKNGLAEVSKWVRAFKIILLVYIKLHDLCLQDEVRKIILSRIFY